ncbi:hypothetical protein FKM82_027000 [Ascaphus truei]
MSRGRWAIDDRHMDRERREDLDSVSLKGGKSKRGGNRKVSVTAERGEQEPHASTPAIRARSVGEGKATVGEGSFQSRVRLSVPGLSYSKEKQGVREKEVMHREELVRKGASIPKGTGEWERGGRVAGDGYEVGGVDTRRSRSCMWEVRTRASRNKTGTRIGRDIPRSKEEKHG